MKQASGIGSNAPTSRAAASAQEALGVPEPAVGDSGDFALHMSIGAHVKRAQRALSHSLQLKLAPHEIPIGMWYFLRVLWEEDGLSQRDISHRVGATAGTATEQLRNMELRGLVTRHPSKADRRKIHFFLTDAGVALKSQLLHYPQEVERAALKGLTVGEIGFLRLVLIRIQENLGRLEADAPHEDVAD